MTPRAYRRRREPRQCRCGATISWVSNVCSTCSVTRYLRSRYLSGGILAQGEVAKARRRGELADPHTLQCVDCHGAASEYDHRDYNKPLMVAAVCRGCNVRRGKAIPKVWMLDDWLAYVARMKAVRHSSFARRFALIDSILPDMACAA